MIEVFIQSKKGQFSLLKVTGHSKQNDSGKDIVCAGVSAVITGGFNSIKDINNFDFVYLEGNAEIKAKGTVSEHDSVVIETIINGLKTIAEAYPGYVKIIK